MDQLLDSQTNHFSFEQLLSRSMTRKEFLGYLGFLVLTKTEITSLLNSLTNPNHLNENYTNQAVGYGSSNYNSVEKN